MAPRAAAASSNNFEIMALSTTLHHHISQTPMENWRELCKLLRSCEKKNDDQYLALLDYRTTPSPDIDLSPAQLPIGRRLRNKLPMMESLLQTARSNQQEISRYLKDQR